MSSETVVVTGGRGFVAHHLAQRLVAEGKRVLIFDLPATDTAPPPIPGAVYIDGDIRDPERMLAALPADVETVYHFAAVVGVDRYLASPADVHDINVNGTRNVFQVAASRDAKLVFASTSEVYGKNPNLPWHETSDSVLGSTDRFRWSYAASKISAEQVIDDLARRHSTRSTKLRLFNVYGPVQRPKFVISRNLHRALNGLALEVHNGGRQTRCFTYVDDVVTAIVRAGRPDTANGRTINIGTDRETSMRDAVESLRTVLDDPTVKIEVLEGGGDDGYEDVPRRVPAIERAVSELGWRPSTDLMSGLSATVEWARTATWWTGSGRDQGE